MQTEDTETPSFPDRLLRIVNPISWAILLAVLASGSGLLPESRLADSNLWYVVFGALVLNASLVLWSGARFEKRWLGRYAERRAARRSGESK